MSAPAVLIVDDEPKVCQALRRAMHREPYEVLSAADAEEALKLLAERDIDVVIADENMPGLKGSMLLARIRSQWPDIVRMMLTGDARLETVVSAVNRGEIFRFFIKPANEAEIIVSVREALKTRAQKRERGLLSPRRTGEPRAAEPPTIKLGERAERRSAPPPSDDGEADPVISLDSGISGDVDGLLDEIKTELDKLEG
jgi:DNA-binding NtrC family response regulator